MRQIAKKGIKILKDELRNAKNVSASLVSSDVDQSLTQIIECHFVPNRDHVVFIFLKFSSSENVFLL